MGHDHHHHDHSHAHHASAKRIGLAFFLNLAFTLVEIGGAFWTHSAAVFSGALHDLGDCLVLGAAWYLQHVAVRGRDARYSYGYARYGMLGGWLAAIVLGIGSITIVGITIARFNSATEVHSIGMMLIAAFGLVMNFIAMWALSEGHSLNERGARLHLFEDVLGWAAVLLGGIVLHFTGSTWIDPALSIAIALFILYNAAKVLREGTGILMQRLPADIDDQRITRALRALPHVTGTHDQHAWTLDGHYTVLTVHLVLDVADPARMLEVKRSARATLDTLGIAHATIELETSEESCALEHH